MPPTSKELVDRWKDNVWNQPEILEFTPNIHAGDVTQDLLATADLRRVIYCNAINFVQYFIQRLPVPSVGACLDFQHRVQIEYYREDSEYPPDSQLEIQAFFETLDNTVRTSLGFQWGGCVDGYEPSDTFPNIRQFGEINSRVIRVGSFEYFAQSHIGNS